MNAHQISGLSKRIARHIGAAEFETRALEYIRSACGVDKAAMMYHGRSDRDSRILLAPFLTDAERRTYEQEFMTLNPMVAPARIMPIGKAMSSLRYVPLRSYRRHPYYEWARSRFSPIEFAVVVSRSATDAVLLTCARSEGKGDVTQRQLRTLDACVEPFRRAFLLHRRLRDENAGPAAVSETLLDLVDAHHACFALSGETTIVDVNGNAESMLVEASILQSIENRLEFRDPDAQRGFAAALRLQPQGSTVSLSCSYGTQLRVTILDARGLHVPTSRGQGAHWLVILALPDSTLVERRVRAFAIEHGLTDTEARVVAMLVSGQDAGEAAAALGQSLATTRSHIKHVFQKSGINRQSLLCSRVLLRTLA